jgi:hypothetical protein
MRTMRWPILPQQRHSMQARKRKEEEKNRQGFRIFTTG